MAMRGGYKILDFKGLVFDDSTEATVKGAFDAIESTYKVIRVSGLKLDPGSGSVKEFPDVDVFFDFDSGEYVGTIPLSEGKYISIVVAEDDGVTVSIVTPTE